MIDAWIVVREERPIDPKVLGLPEQRRVEL